MIFLLLSCDDPVVVADRIAPELLSGTALARRISLDLRGVPPSLEELDAVEADPAVVWSLRDEWLADPRLEERLVWLLSERWLTRIDSFNVEETDYYYDPTEALSFARAVGEEPLRLMARVAVDGRPWTDIVTSDHTMANDYMVENFPLVDLDGQPLSLDSDWQEARYTDNRPAAGVLATNGLWWRYTTTYSNLNRARVAAMVDLLLCEDLLARPISFSGVGEVLQNEDANAVLDEPTCKSCHTAIEPLAASLFGFWWTIQFNAAEMSTYHPEREAMGPETLGVTPAYFGVPIAGLSDVGELMAQDSRFWRCSAESMAELLWRRDVSSDDFDRISNLMSGFVASEGDMLSLIADITQTPEYRDPAPRMLSPDQLSTTHTELTGFTWSLGGHDLLDNDTWGFRVLAGGMDGALVTRPQSDPGLTWALTLERLAQASAGYALADPSALDPSLFGEGLSMQDLPGDDAFETALSMMWRRMLSREMEAAERDSLAALWSEAAALSDAPTAWRVVLSAVMRDPEFVVR